MKKISKKLLLLTALISSTVLTVDNVYAGKGDDVNKDNKPPIIDYSINNSGVLFNTIEESNKTSYEYFPLINIQLSDKESGIKEVIINGKPIYTEKSSNIHIPYRPDSSKGSFNIKVKDVEGNITHKVIDYTPYILHIEKEDKEPTINPVFDSSINTLKSISIKLNALYDKGIIETRYALGTFTIPEMRNKSLVNNDTFNVTKNGIYTIYIKDTSGKEIVKEFTVKNVNENILEKTPELATYFNDISWVERSGILSLSLLQKKESFKNITKEKRDEVFKQLENTLAEDYRWNNQSKSIYDQYVCHVGFASDKSDWNLEPQRPVVKAIDLLLSSCNPPINGAIPKTDVNTFVFDKTKLLFNKK